VSCQGRTYQHTHPTASARQYLWPRADLTPAARRVRRELARELVTTVWPELRPLGIKFFLVSIGPPARAAEFCALTGFPRDHLLADPDNALYAALGMRKDLGSTFFNIAARAPGPPRA